IALLCGLQCRHHADTPALNAMVEPRASPFDPDAGTDPSRRPTLSHIHCTLPPGVGEGAARAFPGPSRQRPLPDRTPVWHAPGRVVSCHVTHRRSSAPCSFALCAAPGGIAPPGEYAHEAVAVTPARARPCRWLRTVPLRKGP